MITSCFVEMSSWVRMLIHVAEAEYPHFSVLNSLGVFDVSAVDEASVDKDISLKRCAKIAKVDPAAVKAEYEDLLPYAIKFYESAPTKGSTEAWKRVMEEMGKKKSLRLNHPMGNLGEVLQRVVCYKGCSTTKVERTFACQKPITDGSRGADKGEAIEVAELKVKQDLKDEAVDKVIALAQEKWRRNFKPPRSSGSENRKARIDKGIARDKTSRRARGTEAAWLKKRKLDVAKNVEQALDRTRPK